MRHGINRKSLPFKSVVKKKFDELLRELVDERNKPSGKGKGVDRDAGDTSLAQGIHQREEVTRQRIEAAAAEMHKATIEMGNQDSDDNGSSGESESEGESGNEEVSSSNSRVRSGASKKGSGTRKREEDVRQLNMGHRSGRMADSTRRQYFAVLQSFRTFCDTCYKGQGRKRYEVYENKILVYLADAVFKRTTRKYYKGFKSLVRSAQGPVCFKNDRNLPDNPTEENGAYAAVPSRV